MNNARAEKREGFAAEMPSGILGAEMETEPDNALGEIEQNLLDLAKRMEMWNLEQRKFSTITKKINQGAFIDDIMVYVFYAFQEVIPYNRIGLALLEDEGRVLRARWVRTDVVNITIPPDFSQRMEGSSLNRIMETGEPRVINDLEAYLLEHPDSVSTQLIVEEGVRSSLTCPLIAQGKPIGFIFFSSSEKNTYKERHQEIFLRIADQLASVLEKNRLYEDLQRLKDELDKTRDELDHHATHDALTELWDRRAMNQLLEKEIARAKRNGDTIAIMMINIDHFKNVNKAFGHQEGDEIIAEVARRLKAISRTEDHVGRYGGEGFQIVLSMPNTTHIKTIAERYRSKVSATPVVFSGGEFSITISLGVGIGQDFEQVDSGGLVKLADEALSEAKASGRNQTAMKTMTK